MPYNRAAAPEVCNNFVLHTNSKMVKTHHQNTPAATTLFYGPDGIVVAAAAGHHVCLISAQMGVGSWARLLDVPWPLQGQEGRACTHTVDVP